MCEGVVGTLLEGSMKVNLRARENLQPVPAWEAQRVESVRERMRAAGCVFDFTVRTLGNCDSSPSATCHRAVLGALFHEVQALNPGFRLRVDLEHAQPTQWNADQVVDPRKLLPHKYASSTKAASSVTDFEWLFQAFDDPPYSARCETGLFADFCEVTGIWPVPNLEVFDWVGNPDTDPGRSAWSNYFDEGKEWWGVWCLTVWNPRKKTLSALAASSTD